MKNEELFQDSMLVFINSDVISSESGKGFIGGGNFLLITFLPPAVVEAIQSWDPTEP